MSEIHEPEPHIEKLPEPEPTSGPTKYGGRNELLTGAGRLKEANVDVDGITYIVRELTGSERAKLLGLQAQKFDLDRYQRQLLLTGLCDPESPEGAREPALVEADLTAAMRNGASMLDPILEKIEELSGLSVDVKEAAKSDSPLAESETSTSDSLAS